MHLNYVFIGIIGRGFEYKSHRKSSKDNIQNPSWNSLTKIQQLQYSPKRPGMGKVSTENTCQYSHGRELVYCMPVHSSDTRRVLYFTELIMEYTVELSLEILKRVTAFFNSWSSKFCTRFIDGNQTTRSKIDQINLSIVANLANKTTSMRQLKECIIRTTLQWFQYFP